MDDCKIKLIARTKHFRLAEKVAETMVNSINNIPDEDAQRIWEEIGALGLHETLCDIDNALYEGNLPGVYHAIVLNKDKEEKPQPSWFKQMLGRLFRNKQDAPVCTYTEKIFCSTCQSELGLDSLVTSNSAAIVYCCNTCGAKTTLTASHKLW